MTGQLQWFDDEKQRWEVKIASDDDDDIGKVICIKPENLESCARNRTETFRHFKPVSLQFIVLRPVDFNQRDVHWFIGCDIDESHCFRIPTHLQSKELSELQGKLFSFDRLVLINRETYPLKILKKFESPRFTHVFRGAERSHSFIIIDFPR